MKPTLEVDPSAGSAYFRVSKAKVARTQEVTARKSRVVCTQDFDSKGELVGIEVVGIKIVIQ